MRMVLSFDANKRDESSGGDSVPISRFLTGFFTEIGKCDAISGVMFVQDVHVSSVNKLVSNTCILMSDNRATIP